MEGYYFKYKNLYLAKVWANSIEEAKEKALQEHSWCGVNCSSQLTLIRVNSNTMFS